MDCVFGILPLWMLFQIGLSYIFTNPANVSVCENETALFICEINETQQISWRINNQPLFKSGYLSLPSTDPLPFGRGARSVLTVPGYSTFDGAQIICLSSTFTSTSAFLTLHALVAPVNLTVTLFNLTYVKLTWKQTISSPLSSYSFYIQVKNKTGSVIYSETIQGSQATIKLPDPCDRYEMTVSSTCSNVADGVVKAYTQGGRYQPDFQIATSLSFPESPQGNVTMNITIVLYEPTCSYQLVARHDDIELLFIKRLLLPDEEAFNNVVHLPSNKQIIISCSVSSVYGNSTKTVSISTFDVIGVSIDVSTTAGLGCLFQPTSKALGCLLNLTNTANGLSYCLSLIRATPNLSLCPPSKNSQLLSGVYRVEAYDIESDGSVSEALALHDFVVIGDYNGFLTKSMSPIPTLSGLSSSPTIPYDLPFDTTGIMVDYLTIILASCTVGLLWSVLWKVFIAILCWRLKTRKRRKKKFVANQSNEPLKIITSKKMNEFRLDSCVAYCPKNIENSTKLDPLDIQKYSQLFLDVLISFDRLQMDSNPVGEGAFGVVYKAVYETKEHDSLTVAVKMIKDLYSKSDVKAFFEESARMKSFKHPNIMELIGMCVDSPDGVPLMVMPFMVNGSLKSYLQESRTYSQNVDTYPKNLSNSILTKMCLDIAQGMNYLAKKRFVHRDLAARNCIQVPELLLIHRVDESNSIKVGDFGLSRNTSGADYYRLAKSEKCPVKWMSPEMLRDGMSTEKSDVWAYGVTCWEVFTLGSNPYPGVENYEMLDYLNRGHRLPKPVLCCGQHYTIIQQCWSDDPEKRLSFNQLIVLYNELSE